MAFSSVFEKLGRAVFESPFESRKLAKDAPELAEIRLAAIDAIRAKSHRVGAQNVFPYDLVRVQLAGIPPEQEPIFRSGFIRRFFADELKSALTRSSFRYPGHLSVEFDTTPRLPSAGESWISVETAMQEEEETTSDQKPAQTPARSLPTLTVQQGTANLSELPLEKTRTNIGRTIEVFHAGGPSRRNDLAFTGDGEAEKTVSREHAHILRSAAGYRLFNDRSYRGDTNCGLWIVRDGMSFPVHHGARGSLLRSGDEIHLGTAVVLFSWNDALPLPEEERSAAESDTIS